MIMVKARKKGNDNNLNGRFCRMGPETKEHILQECSEIGNTIGKCNYESIFKDGMVNSLPENAELIIKIEEKLKLTN